MLNGFDYFCCLTCPSFLLCFLQANGAAAVGKYSGSGAGAAGGESLFVANHAY